MSEIPEFVRIEARKELARRNFYDYCQLMYSKYYTDDRKYLKEICDTLQWFVQESNKHFLVLNVPPRHIKSNTGKNFTEWLFGQDIHNHVMTGSYNETLSTMFAKKVRNTIATEKASKNKIIYSHLFPKTKIRYGDAAMSMWSLDGADDVSYLATSLTGTSTGIGCNIMLIDDVIKSALEALNDATLDKIWDWFVDTMMSRLESDNFKVICIMTRWSTRDLAGRIISEYGDEVVHVNFPAVNKDGTMLCPSILSKKAFELKTKNMSREIVEANYNQKPIDIQGKLYKAFTKYTQLPEGSKDLPTYNYTDTADRGTDFLCSIDYKEIGGDAYVIDAVFSDEDMETTEPLVTEMLINDEVNEAFVESNNGGRGYGRNLDRLMNEAGYKKCVITDINQTSNKEARILSSSAWVQKHIIMPDNWEHKWPKLYENIMTYQRKGKNAHDDGPDVLAGIYEHLTGGGDAEYLPADELL